MTGSAGDVLLGYTGTRCEVNPDDCVGVACVHGSCVDGANSYRCHCDAGYTGHLCEHEINECDGQPCEYGGTCIDHLNYFTCICPNGTTGTLSTVPPHLSFYHPRSGAVIVLMASVCKSVLLYACKQYDFRKRRRFIFGLLVHLVGIRYKHRHARENKKNS